MMTKANIENAVTLLGELHEVAASDPERAHAQADIILLAALPIEIREAYERLTKVSPWWAAA